MASLFYVDGDGFSFSQNPISDIVSMCLEPVDATKALRKIERFIQLLLLSNHIERAHVLMCTLFEQSSAIQTKTGPNNAWRLAPRPFDYFWEAHPEYFNPWEEASTKATRDEEEAASAREASAKATGDEKNTSTKEVSAKAKGKEDAASARTEKLWASQWCEYRECTRTGWMLEHCNLAEPEDPHVWRETDDGPMIAMCARLLAKNKTHGQYATRENMQEALDAARKLYAQPQVPATEWKYEYKGSQTVRRHSYLLYRRLVVELAIKLGELDSAAEMLSLGLVLDGFNYVDGAEVNRYLYVPGIYDVLPLLAQKKKRGNPFYIEADDADAMVEEITAVLKLRAREGRQWSLAPEKVGWEELLNRLAKAAWTVNRTEYEKFGITSAEDILHPPATEEEIEKVEAEVGQQLPPDFKDMLLVADG